jgi:hypothetical protein
MHLHHERKGEGDRKNNQVCVFVVSFGLYCFNCICITGNPAVPPPVVPPLAPPPVLPPQPPLVPLKQALDQVIDQNADQHKIDQAITQRLNRECCCATLAPLKVEAVRKFARSVRIETWEVVDRVRKKIAKVPLLLLLCPTCTTEDEVKGKMSGQGWRHGINPIYWNYYVDVGALPILMAYKLFIDKLGRDLHGDTLDSYNDFRAHFLRNAGAVLTD